MTHLKSIMLAGVIAVSGASGASALSYKWAETITPQGEATVSAAANNGTRTDPGNALGAPDATGSSGFFSLGRTEYADFTFGSGGPFTGGSIVFEVTNNIDRNPESANVFAFLAGSAPNSNDSSETSFVTSVPNTSAQSGFTFNVTSTFDTIRIWDTTEDTGSDGFDVDAVGVVPLPAAAWLLLSVSGALVAAKRRSVRRAA